MFIANQVKADVSGGIFSTEKTLTLPNGENQILFLYKPYFTQGNDRIILESDPIIAKFSAHDAALTFSLPQYRNSREAKQNIKSAQWALIDSQGNKVAVSQEQLLKEGMQIGRDYAQEVAEYNRGYGVASVGSATTPPVTQASTLQPTLQGDNTAEQMLHFWYNKADAETKLRFKKAIQAE